MIPGIPLKQNLVADQPVAASTVLVDVTGFTIPIAIGQTIHWRAKVGFTLGATGGFKFRLDVPAQNSFLNIQEVNDGVTASPGAQIESIITAPADFANALAVAGNHALEMEGSVTATAAGNVKLQFACNSAANAITLLKGSWFEITKM